MYDDDKEIHQLNATATIADADLVVIQKDSDGLVYKIPFAAFAAMATGQEYRSATVSKLTGNQLIHFSSALPDANYQAIVIALDPNNIGVPCKIIGKYAGILEIWLGGPANVTYYVIPNR